ncbi:MAG: glycoside hydrolase family 15 protein [Actinomycetes bacterium]
MTRRQSGDVRESGLPAHCLDGGYAPLADYAVIGDGRTVALVTTDGCIDWWPVPTMDAPPAFAAILDPHEGGHLVMCPVDEFRTTRRYVPGTNVLETTFTTDTGRVRVLDCLSFGASGLLPWNELIRHVEGLEGEVEMRWMVAPGSRFESARPWSEHRDGTLLLHLGDQHMAVMCFDVGQADDDGHRAWGRFTAKAGASSMLAIASTDNEPLFLPRRDHLERRLARTISRWQSWSERMTYEGPWAEQVKRSALALDTLLYRPHGAIAAAATTSLPERIGGPKNYDYRYTWIRDSSFTLDAFIRLGLDEEVHECISSFLDVLRRTSPDLHVFYKLDGDLPDEQVELSSRGYQDSQPVRSGNDAAGQTQLGTFGDLFDTVWRYVQEGHAVDANTARLLADIADRCADIWQVKDAGIWELHQREHYTISKIGCWVALDRAVRLADQHQIDGRHAGRWAMERDDVHRWVNEHCWDEHQRSYTMYAGTDKLDAAVLLAGRTGFDRGERLAGTVDAVSRRLATGPYVYRYTGADKEEGAFIACTFWLADALVVLKRFEEAEQLLKSAMELPNDVGILSEEADPKDGSFLGNLPQGLSHLALINSVLDYAQATDQAHGISWRRQRASED